MIVTCDDANFDAVCSLFGHPATSGSPGINPTVPTAAGALHPIFNGPFGVVTAINEAGTQGAFTSTTGATVLAQDSTPGTPLPDVMMQQFGAGHVIFLADVDLIANAASAGATITSQNDRFLGNLFVCAAVVSATVPIPAVPVPTLTTAGFAVLSLLLVCAVAIRWRRRGGFA
jgi:hypothetical protein